VLQLLQRFALRREMPPPRPVLSVPPARSPLGGLHAPEGSSAAPARLRARPSSSTGEVLHRHLRPHLRPHLRRVGLPSPPSIGTHSGGIPPSTAVAASGPSPATTTAASGFSPAVTTVALGVSPTDAPDALGLSPASPAAGPTRSSTPSSGRGPSRCC
jgi:hypothetical protein